MRIDVVTGSPYPGYFPFDSLEVSVMAPVSLSFSGQGQLVNAVAPDTAAPTTSTPQKLRIERATNCSHVSQQTDLDTALQYGIASGYPPLYAWLRKLVLTVYHPGVPYPGGPNLIISGGSADGLAKVYDVFFNFWDKDVHRVEDREGLLVEEFVYPPALAQVRSRDPNIVPVKMDTEGALADGPGGLLDVLENWDFTKGKRPHMFYSVP